MSDHTYYISTGDKTAMYTLRCQYMGINGLGERDLMDDYICNLATTKEKALAKAHAVVEGYGDGAGVSFTGFDLDEIKRRKDGEAKAAREAEEAERQAAFEEREKARIASGVALVTQGRFPFGKYREQQFEVAEHSYVRYLADNFEQDESDPVIRLLLAELKKVFPVEFEELPEPNGEYVSQWSAKDKIELSGTVVALFSYESHYGYVNVTKIVLDSGHLVVHSGNRSFDARVGEKIELKATVKGFNEYNDEKQTLIIRPKRLN